MSLAAHRPRNVLADPPAEEDLPDDPRSPEPAAEPPAGLDVRTLAHQLPRGAPPVPLPVRPHVLKGTQSLSISAPNVGVTPSPRDRSNRC